MNGQSYEGKEKEIETLEVDHSRFAHRSRGRVDISTAATLGAAIYDADRTGVVASVLHHRMFHGEQVRWFSGRK